MRDADLDHVLASALEQEHIERFSFADLSGLVVTEAGSLRLSALLYQEVSRHDAADVLEASLDDFEPLNGEFLSTLSRWQLESTSATQSGFGDANAAEVEVLLACLTSIGSRLRAVLAGLTRALPRFGRYAAQYDAALSHASTDGLRWVTGVGLLSCHVVWAELHQDLLSTSGRARLDPQAR
ncbi:MAG: hypothetical protein V9G15_09320 [Dermatophilaceae bacterium]